jgi:hypothetical protein
LRLPDRPRHCRPNDVLAKPKVWDDPSLEILWERGARHEQSYVVHLRNSGCTITVIDGVGVERAGVSRTIDAMSAGSEIIVQGAFSTEGWGGRTDILRRVGIPSELGAWSYEVIDAKLSREAQFCSYASTRTLWRRCRASCLNPHTSWRLGSNMNHSGSGRVIMPPTIGVLRAASIRRSPALQAAIITLIPRNIATFAGGGSGAMRSGGMTTSMPKSTELVLTQPVSAQPSAARRH